MICIKKLFGLTLLVIVIVEVELPSLPANVPAYPVNRYVVEPVLL
jgi:hypothetical protein